MAIQINLKKCNNKTPWGFRLVGGSECNLPIIISKISEDSVAEESGLQQDDIVVRINDIQTTGLTHDEVHNLLLCAGNEISLTVRRENIETVILKSINDEEHNNEIVNILRQAIENEKNIQNSKRVFLQLKENVISEENIELKLGGTQARVSDTEGIMRIPYNPDQAKPSQHDSQQERKWSTFLQRPSNPKPRPKNEQQIEPVHRYKVTIKKQPKKTPPEKYDKETVEESESEELKEEIEREETPLEIEMDFNTVNGEEITSHDDETEGPVHAFYAEVIDEQENVQEDANVEIPVEEIPSENEAANVTVENVVTEVTLTLEEQLAAVQKQLQELSKLPSAIQTTLCAVTQELANIVGSTKQYIEEELGDNVECDSQSVEEQNVDEENYSQTSEDKDEVVLENQNESNVLADNMAEGENRLNENGELIENIDIDDQTISEDDAEANQIEEEKLVKQEKESENGVNLMQTPKIPPKPIERPIILPGGRKWCAPDDACPPVKNPKMSDDKICATIETYSEIISGRTKGINFLKYQPPPKNLDYLQRSDVYRLVHDMEPPVKGISIRSEKIMAENDYYTEIDST